MFRQEGKATRNNGCECAGLEPLQGGRKSAPPEEKAVNV